MAIIDQKCLDCGVATEDVDICGYCFADKMDEIRDRNLEFAPGLNQVGIDREIAFMADIEIRLQAAEDAGDHEAIAIYQRVLELLNS